MAISHLVRHASPFLKWVGGKTQLLPVMLNYIPAHFDTYIEPFIGGGALFFELQPTKAVLADSNPELINCYTMVRDQVEDLINVLNSYQYSEEFYYAMRAETVEILHHTKTKKLRKYLTPFDSRTEVYGAFERLLQKFADSIIVVSYSSNSLPNREELTAMLKQIKGNVKVHLIEHKYSFGTHAHKLDNQNNTVQEYLFVAY